MMEISFEKIQYLVALFLVLSWDNIIPQTSEQPLSLGLLADMPNMDYKLTGRNKLQYYLRNLRKPSILFQDTAMTLPSLN